MAEELSRASIVVEKYDHIAQEEKDKVRPLFFMVGFGYPVTVSNSKTRPLKAHLGRTRRAVAGAHHASRGCMRAWGLKGEWSTPIDTG